MVTLSMKSDKGDLKGLINPSQAKGQPHLITRDPVSLRTAGCHPAK